MIFFAKILSISSDFSNIKVGLEATGHYSYNLLGYLLDKGLHLRHQSAPHKSLQKKSQP